jgi:hypothetical protein
MVLLMLVLVVALAGPASAAPTQVHRTPFSTTVSSAFDEWGVPGTGWSHQSNQHIMGYVGDWPIVTYDDSSDPRLTGRTVYMWNGLSKNDLEWNTLWTVGGGTYRTETTLGDWEGTFHFKTDYVAGTAVSWGTARGVSGSVAGLVVTWTSVHDPFADPVVSTGYIMEH